LRQGSEKQSLTSSNETSSNSSVAVGSGRTSDRDELLVPMSLTWQSMRLTAPEEDVNGALFGHRMQNFCEVSG